ncbi:MAG: GNAT family N-acetyltransferase [Parvibaculaceae bacterium]
MTLQSLGAPSLVEKVAQARLKAALGGAMRRGVIPGADVRLRSGMMTVPAPSADEAMKAATEVAVPMSFGRKGTLEVRIATTPAEIDAAQALRYHVFYEEMSATPDAETRATRRDVDRFDSFCDHLLVFDHKLVDGAEEGIFRPETVVGCYRLLRQSVADCNGGFYTANEFEIDKLLARAGPDMQFLELGRSCVLQPYRTRPTVELLWHGIAQYVASRNLDVMIGCASFEGTDAADLAIPLSYLYHYHLTPDEWHVRALPDRFTEMNLIPKDQINPKQAWRMLPPMIKGYLRAGCYIGDGAVIDKQFGTTDVLIVFPVAQIAERYANKFGSTPNS